MSEANKSILDDSSLVVTVTVGQLKALVREEVETAVGQNGHHDGDDLLNSKAAAGRLSVPVSKVRDMARKGELPCVRIGYYIRFQPEDLDQYIKDHKG